MTDTAFDVALFGEAMLLLVADRPGPLEDAQSFHKRTAGAETNVAIGLSRLGREMSTTRGGSAAEWPARLRRLVRLPRRALEPARRAS